ncbi:MAG: DMT family transporter [Myxococcota bacterium]
MEADRAKGNGAGVAALVLAVTAFSWGFILVKALGLPAATIGFWRLLVGAAVLIGVAGALRVPWPPVWAPVVGAGVCFGLHQLVFIAATQWTSVAIVTLIVALQPLVVALVSRKTVGERVPLPLLLWACVGVLGVAVVVLANLGDASRSLAGDLLAVVNLFLFTAYFLFSKRARVGGAPTLTLTAGMLGVALVTVTPALAFVAPIRPVHGWQWGLVAVLALVPGNGHLLVNWAHARVSAALASLVLAAVPLLSSIWASLLFDEPYGPWHLVGMLLAAAAIEGGRRAEARHARGARTA